jgi:hypothetical protein
MCSSFGNGFGQTATTKRVMMNLAFVLLPKARLPKAEEIARAFDHFATTREQRLLPKGSKADEKNDVEVLEFEIQPGGSAFVALMPVPVPNREADDAAKFSLSAMGTGWKLPVHSAHAIVTLKDTKAVMADRLSLFTSLVAAVTEASNAVGVYWGEAGATHDPKFFLSMAEDRDVYSRIMLWTGVSVAHEKDGRLSLLSIGMKQLNLPDLLLIAPKSTPSSAALTAFFDFLGYCVEFGKALPEGDTIGRTADERLLIHYVISPMDPKAKVWRVELK